MYDILEGRKSLLLLLLREPGSAYPALNDFWHIPLNNYKYSRILGFTNAI
jgi:hypothetical protein